MKQTLAVKLGQQLKMTPQLQQAIKLLQMSSLELSEEIENALEENPLLEREDEQEVFVDDSSPTDIPDFSEGSESDNNQRDKQLEALSELTGKTTENNEPEGDEAIVEAVVEFFPPLELPALRDAARGTSACQGMPRGKTSA